MIKKIYILLLSFFVIFLTNGNLLSQSLNWGYVFGTASSDYGRDVAKDSENNVILVGTFNGTCDFDNSAGTFLLTSTQTAGFVAKYKQNGDILWALAIQNNSSFVDITNVEIDDNDNIYILANISVNSEVNPNGSSVILNTADGPLFVIKYDKDGNYLASVGGISQVGGVSIPSMKIDKDNQIYVTSSFTGSIDIDPTANVQTLTTNGLADWSLSKYSEDLEFLWAFGIGGTGSEHVESIFISESNEIFICGGFENTVDFDPSGSVNSFTSIDGFDAYIAKYDNNGNFIFCKQFTGTDDQFVNDIIVFDDELYIVGEFKDNIDVNPDVGVQIYTIGGAGTGTDVWFGKYDLSDGSLISAWHLVGGGTFASEGRKILIDDWGYIYLGILGWGVIDFDPSAATVNVNLGLNDISIAKYTNNGELVWSGFLNGGEIDGIAGMVFDLDYNLLICGNIRSNPVNFDIEGGSSLSTPFGAEDIMFASYKLKVPPKLTFSGLTEIGTNSIIGNFGILDNGNSNIQTIGIVIKEGSNPTIDDNDFIYYYSKDSLEFNIEIGNLYSNANYFISAFATNEEYTGYSDEVNFRTLPTEEDNAPNNGDGNNDGILDSRQSNVLSIKTTNEKYITIEEINGLEIYDSEIFEQREITSQFYFPLGEIGFKINSSYARIKIYFEGINDFSSYIYRKRLSNEKYTNLPLLNMGTDTIAGNPTAYIEFELLDGSPFDNDGLTNGIIYDPGGPALLITEENIPTLSEWARIILLSSFVFFGVWWSRKRLLK